MATIFEGFIIAITILSTNIADGNKIWGFIMVTQHIPTMTKSHHGGEMSVMIKVGICQWQNPTIHEKYYWEYICLKVPHITTGNQENILLFFGGAQIFLVEKIYFGIHFQFLKIQNQCAFSWKQELQVKNFEPRDYSKRTANQVSMRETEGREKPNKCNQCAYASYHAGNLGKHLKIHCGEKTKKGSKCDYVSSEASHFEMHLTKVEEMQTPEDTNKNTGWLNSNQCCPGTALVRFVKIVKLL